MNGYYPRLFALWFPVSTRPFLITCHPETCKQVLKHTLQKPVKYGGYSGLIPWIGKDCFRIIIYHVVLLGLTLYPQNYSI